MKPLRSDYPGDQWRIQDGAFGANAPLEQSAIPRPEPNMLKILPIILTRISQKISSPIILFLILLSSLLFHNNANLVSVAIVT